MKLHRFGIFCLLLLAGCGGANESFPDLVGVTGVVTIHGKPEGDLVVVFMPESNTEDARGWTDAKGHFVLMTRNKIPGATPGRYRVCFLSNRIDSNIIPEKYSASSPGIPVEVTQDGPNEFKFNL